MPNAFETPWVTLEVNDVPLLKALFKMRKTATCQLPQADFTLNLHSLQNLFLILTIFITYSQ